MPEKGGEKLYQKKTGWKESNENDNTTTLYLLHCDNTYRLCRKKLFATIFRALRGLGKINCYLGLRDDAGIFSFSIVLLAL